MLVQLTGFQVELLRDQIVTVYGGAFGGPPYFKTRREIEDFASWLLQHILRPDFRFVGGFDEESGRIVGFAYGYASVPGQWWHDQVSRSLGEARAREWLSDAFQLSEIAVTSSHQGRGLGRRLHDAVLGVDGSKPGPLTQSRAVLSTLAAETVALRMYYRYGWQDLLESFLFPGVQRVYRILGRADLSHDMSGEPGGD